MGLLAGLVDAPDLDGGLPGFLLGVVSPLEQRTSLQHLDFALRLQDLAVLGDRVVGDAQELGLPVVGTFRVRLDFGLDDSHALLFVEMVSGKLSLANPGDLVGLGAEPFDDLCLDLLVGDAKGF